MIDKGGKNNPPITKRPNIQPSGQDWQDCKYQIKDRCGGIGYYLRWALFELQSKSGKDVTDLLGLALRDHFELEKILEKQYYG